MEPTKLELFAEEWLKDHGYGVKILSRELGGTVYRVSGHGRTEDYRVPLYVPDRDGWKKSFILYWEGRNGT